MEIARLFTGKGDFCVRIDAAAVGRAAPARLQDKVIRVRNSFVCACS
jgi:hypothetical protein